MIHSVIAAILTYLLYSTWAPDLIIYSIAFIGIILSVVLVLAIFALRLPPIETEPSVMIDLYVQLNRDLRLNNILGDIYAIFILFIVNVVYFNSMPITLLFGIGLLLLVYSLITHLDNTCSKYIKEILKFLKEEKDDEEDI